LHRTCDTGGKAFSHFKQGKGSTDKHPADSDRADDKFPNLGDLEKAIESYTRVIELDPNNKMGYYQRGQIFGKTGKLQLAVDDFTSALRIDPGFSLASQYREVAYQRLKMKK
ncbi:MAG: tetratricopeptide repeat protein, partial [Bacteroidota bacterium]